MRTLDSHQGKHYLLMLENQDHFLRPYGTQHLHVMAHINSKRRMPHFPEFGTPIYDAETNRVTLSFNMIEGDFDIESYRFSLIYTDQDGVQSFSKGWRRISVETEEFGVLRCDLPLLVGSRIWVSFLCEISGRFAVSSPIAEFDANQRFVHGSQAEFQVDGSIPVDRQPVGDRISPQVSLAHVDNQDCYEFNFADPVSMAVMYGLDGASVAKLKPDYFSVQLCLAEDGLDPSELFLMLVTDYHGCEERCYGICLDACFDSIDKGVWQTISVELASLVQMDFRKMAFCNPKQRCPASI